MHPSRRVALRFDGDVRPAALKDWPSRADRTIMRTTLRAATRRSRTTRSRAQAVVAMNAPDSPTDLRPPTDVDGWVRRFRAVEIPVLPATSEALEELRAIEDDVDARMLGDVIAKDPLMSLKVLAHASQQGSPRRSGDVETVVEALVLMGITPFFRAFGRQPTIEEHLAAHPDALAGLTAVLDRADRAARFSAMFAIHRNDHDAAVLQEAALLHDFTEMLLWLHAPALALEIRRRQEADPTLRSSTVQKALLHAELNDIQHGLMRLWRLPEILVRITDDRQADHTQVRNVLLAIRLARHTTHGWDNPALPDDLRDIASLLHLGVEPTRLLVRELDA
jgi:HD-like signal output (HDOD) protein